MLKFLYAIQVHSEKYLGMLIEKAHSMYFSKNHFYNL